MIEFKKITLKNFYSYGNEETVIDYDNYNFVIITGENGSGKSVLIIDSLYFALFGKSFRGVNKAKIINNINKKNCVVTLEFKKNNVYYKIIRGMKPNKFEIYKNDKKLDSMSSDTELQKQLENNILQFNEKIFKQVCLFGSALYVPFLQLSLADRRFIVENLLGLEIFSEMQSVIKYKLKEYKLKVNEYSTEIEKFASNLKIMEENYKKGNEYKQSQIKKQQELIKEYAIKRAAKFLDIETFDDKIKEQEDNIAVVDEKIEKLNKQGEFANSFERKLYSKKSKFETEISSVEKQLQKLEGKNECPLCHSKANNFTDLLVQYKDKIKIHQESLAEIESEIREFNVQNDKFNEKYKSLVDQKNKYVDAKKDLNYQKSAINSDIQRLNNNIEHAEGEIKNVEKTELTDKKSIDDIKDKINSTEKKHHKELKNVSIYSILKDVTGDSGIKTYIIDKYLNVINDKINYYLNRFSLGFNFEFDNQFNDKIISRTKAGITYSGISEGQKARINNAIMFTFIHIAQKLNSVNTNILFLDEILDSNSLDELGIQSLLQEIKLIGKEESKKIFVNSHGEVLKNFFDEHIKVYFKGLFSKYE